MNMSPSQLHFVVCRNPKTIHWQNWYGNWIKTNVQCKHEYHSMNWKCYKFVFVLPITGEGRRRPGSLCYSCGCCKSHHTWFHLWHVQGCCTLYPQHGCNQFTAYTLIVLTPAAIWYICECSAHLKIKPFNSRYFSCRVTLNLNLGMQAWMFSIKPFHQPTISSVLYRDDTAELYK